jgi:hypothetical protein
VTRISNELGSKKLIARTKEQTLQATTKSRRKKE